MGLRARLVESFLAHRARLARLVAVGGALALASFLIPKVPREVTLRYDLGPAHAAVTGLELVYQAGRDATEDDVASARFAFGEEGPRVVEHRLRLPAGSYDVRATLTTAAGRLRYLRRFEAPAQGIVRLELFELALAQGSAPGWGLSPVAAESDSVTNVPSLAPQHGGVSLALRSVLRGRGRLLPPSNHSAAQRHRSES